MNTSAQKIIDCCEANWDQNKSDCSGFVKAVSKSLGVSLTGDADEITVCLLELTQKTTDGVLAAQWVGDGKFVVAGLQGAQHRPPRTHGHVVVVVDGPLAHDKYPTAYWGALGSVGKKNQTLNWAWDEADRDNLIYGAYELA